jgi:AcrR family transcriptional regulator
MARDKVLEAALRLFSGKGFAGTTTSALAREAGIAEGTLFRHFRSKNEILLTLLRKVKGELIRSVERRLEPSMRQNGLERVLAAVTEYYTLASSNMPEFNIIFRDVLSANPQDSTTEAREEVKNAYGYLTLRLEQAIDAGKRDASVRADAKSPETATLLLGTVVGMARAVHFGFVAPETASAEFFRDSCIRLLAPGQSGPGGTVPVLHVRRRS